MFRLKNLSYLPNVSRKNTQIPLYEIEGACSLIHSCPTLCDPHGLQPAWLLCPWNSPGKNIGMGSHSFLQGIFPTQGSNQGHLHCRQILYLLNHQGGPHEIEECFSNSSMLRNQLESLWKHRTLGVSLRFWFSRSGINTETLHFKNFPVVQVLLFGGQYWVAQASRTFSLSPLYPCLQIPLCSKETCFPCHELSCCS